MKSIILVPFLTVSLFVNGQQTVGKFAYKSPKPSSVQPVDFWIHRKGENALVLFKSRLDDTTFTKLQKRLAEVNLDLNSKGFVHDSTLNTKLLTGYNYKEFYDWDLYFENIYLSYYGISEYNFNNLDAFFLRQKLDGFIPRSFGTYNWGANQMFKPFIAQIVMLGSIQQGNFNWAKKNYDKLNLYLQKWFTYDTDKNGLAYWPFGADHSGMDNQTSRCIGNSEGVDLNSYLVRELEAMAIISGKLGYKKQETEFFRHSKTLKSLINKYLWDEQSGFYFDRNELTGKQTKVKSVSCFTPIWANVASKNQVKVMVKNHLLSPTEFWTKYPVPGYAKDEKDYYLGVKGGECNWRGNTWIPLNYMICHGLINYGYKKIASELAYNTFDMVLKNKTTREFFNAETGEGYGCNPFYGWSTLAYFMPLEIEMKYDPTNLHNCKLLRLADLLFRLDSHVLFNGMQELKSVGL